MLQTLLAVISFGRYEYFVIVPPIQCESERKFDPHNVKDEDTGASGAGGED